VISLNIRLAKTAGFCFGVDRAINLVNSLLAQGKKVYTLGPIIHNPQMVRELEEVGCSIISHPTEAPENSVVVIRSHGVGEDIYQQFLEANIEYADATCPFVSKIHNIVKKASGEGSIIFIAGDPNHPEIEGIVGHCCKESYVFKNSSDLQKIIENHPELSEKSVILVAQTTYNADEWKKCVEMIKKVYTNLVVFDTICNATNVRQLEALELARQSDLMIIIGGRESSNTAKLFEVCSAFCPSILIETADELPREKIINANNIGVTAGASTPSCIIKEVLKKMENYENEFENGDEVNFIEALENSLKTIYTNEIVQGVVASISPNEIQVDVGTKHAGYIPLDEFSFDQSQKPEQFVKVGDILDLVVMRVNDQEGTVMLSKKRFEALKGWKSIEQAKEDDTALTGIVVDVVKGGIIVLCEGVRVFIPASQATRSRNDSLESLLKSKVSFKILETNMQRRRAVGSIRAASKDIRKESESKFWSVVEIGKKYTGTVKSLTSYGAFVDLGGIDGMIHISELSWSRIKNPSEVVKEGDVVEVYIKDFDSEKRKISLGYKKQEDNPWEKFVSTYKVGDVVNVKVVSMLQFGAFAQIMPGIDGLIHISQIADKRIEKPQEVLKIGEFYDTKITEIESNKKRVSLSIRALIEPEEVVEDTKPIEEVEEAVKIKDVAEVEHIIEEDAAEQETATSETTTTENL
jgi:(E)-4-hydroxy-3-methyl-but-2-enyl pyrophosphate reductase/ribosomal protein S1